MLPLDFARAMAIRILEDPRGREWSLQGFGMLRTYLPGNKRLHVWSQSHAVPGVSTIHSHPWHFRSTVLCGAVENHIFSDASDLDFVEGIPSRVQKIHCGEGGGPIGSPRDATLIHVGSATHFSGGSYVMRAEWLHESRPRSGTVTLVERFPLDDPDHALVYWPRDSEWVSAEPRPATPKEVIEITSGALRMLRHDAGRRFSND